MQHPVIASGRRLQLLSLMRMMITSEDENQVTMLKMRRELWMCEWLAGGDRSCRRWGVISTDQPKPSILTWWCDDHPLPTDFKTKYHVQLKYMRLDTGAIIWLSVVHCPMPHCATTVDPLSIPRTTAAQLTHGWVYHSVQTKKRVGFWIGKSQNYSNIQIVGKIF